MSKKIGITSFIILGLVICCGAAYRLWLRCPSDEELIRKFNANRPQLERVQQMLKEDGENVAYVGRGKVVVYGSSLSEERRREYLDIVGSIGAINLYQSQGAIGLWFWSDGILITSPTRSKGIVYNLNMRNHFYDFVSKLDGLDHQGSEGYWVRDLGDNWYLVYTQSN